MTRGARDLMTAVVVGCGTIGLAFGVALASRGRNVVLHDSDGARLDRIAAGDEGREEAALHAALMEGLASGLIRTSPVLEGQGQACDYILCVPTADAGLEQLRGAVLAIARAAGPDDALFIRSTVPPGTVRQLHRLVAAHTGRGLPIAAMPDRSIEGRSFADQFVVPHLLGGLDVTAAQRGMALLEGLGQVVAVASPEAAEAAKLFSNVWRASTFALANAFALVADDHGLDVHHVLSAAAAGYPRFSPPRPGLVGGPCLPKDLGLLVESGQSASVALFDAIRRSEAEFAGRIAARAVRHVSQWPGVARIAVLGLAFKGSPPVTDLRGSPALALAAAIAAACPGCPMTGWDPAPLPRQPGGMALLDNPGDAATGCALVVLGHDHPEVLALDLPAISASMAPGGLIMDLTGRMAPPGALANGTGFWSLGHTEETPDDAA